MIVGILFATFFFRADLTTTYPTYFSYKQTDQAPLTTLSSEQKMTFDTLQRWDEIMFDLIEDHKLGDAQASRVYAYVLVAQHDAAFLSFNNKHNFAGNLGPVTAQTLCLLFKDRCPELLVQAQSSADSYSTALATIVSTQIKKRIENDKNNSFYPEKIGKQYWAGISPYFGQDVGNWQPWLIKSTQNFLAAPPPAYDAPEWQHQLKMVKAALSHITPEQKKAVVFWAGNPGTATPPGLWLIFTDDYIASQSVPFSKILTARSVLAMGMADAAIVVFHSKYTYWVKRPFMRDPAIFTVMPTPNHPSYPAGHSTISYAAATILAYYFPEHRDFWFQKANEASLCRVWGGIHFMIDSEQGSILGRRVGEAAIAKGQL